MPNNSTYTFDDYLRAWSNLPDLVVSWIKQFFLFLAYVSLFVGGIMIIWGSIAWATGYDEHSGKKNIIRGIVLIVLSLAPVFTVT